MGGIFYERKFEKVEKSLYSNKKVNIPLSTPLEKKRRKKRKTELFFKPFRDFKQKVNGNKM